MAATHGIGKARVREVIALTGLESVAKKRVGGFSLGMGQRLGIAAALLGDPATLIFDEPVNGLDPEGVVWVRTLARFLASEGRTVFLSSHLMSEMAQTADHLIVLGRGKVLADSPISDVISQASGDAVRVRSPHADHLVSLLQGPDVAVTAVEPGVVELRGITAERVGDLAASSGVVLHELTPLVRSLEDAYMLKIAASPSVWKRARRNARKPRGPLALQQFVCILQWYCPKDRNPQSGEYVANFEPSGWSAPR
jgi:ABC-2 type transport system ATP-binding protein